MSLRGHDRLVAVIPDAEVVIALAEVQRHVLVADDRLPRPGVAVHAGELGDRIGPHELMLHRHERDRHPGERAHRRPQMPAHSSTRSHSTSPRSVRTPLPDPVHVELGDGDPALEPDAGDLCLPRERLDDLHAFAQRRRSAPSTRRRIDRRVEERRTLGGFAARAARSLRDRRNARTPDDASAPACARRSSRPRGPPRRTRRVGRRGRGSRRRDRVPRDPAHRARGFVWKMMPGAWLVDPPVSNKRSLLEHEHVGDTEFGQVIGGGDADDAGADDDGLRAIPHASQLPLGRPRHGPTAECRATPGSRDAQPPRREFNPRRDPSRWSGVWCTAGPIRAGRPGSPRTLGGVRHGCSSRRGRTMATGSGSTDRRARAPRAWRSRSLPRRGCDARPSPGAEHRELPHLDRPRLGTDRARPRQHVGERCTTDPTADRASRPARASRAAT